MEPTVSTQQTASTLSFPPSTFAKLSPHPYLLAHLQPESPSQPSIRANGRKTSDIRSPRINTSSLTHCHGSAVVRMGDTAVVCGVRGEILLSSEVPHLKVSRDGAAEPQNGTAPAIGMQNASKEIDYRALELLVPNLELATGCSPANLPGQPPSTLAMSLSARLRDLLYSTNVIDQTSLAIWHTPTVVDEDAMEQNPSEPRFKQGQREIKAFWVLYIDLVIISLDGNPLDAAWTSIMAALRDVRLPKAWWDADREMVLCSDVRNESCQLNLRGCPTALTAVVFRGTGSRSRTGEERTWILLDPDAFEEGLCDETISLMVERGTGSSDLKILAFSKAGGRVVGKAELRSLVEVAHEHALEVSKALESVVAR